MGTRSITKVYDGPGELLVCIYCQYDGYFSGIGKELAEFLLGRKILNGIPAIPPPKFSNGMGDLAAQLVVALKQKRPNGSVYLFPAGSTQEYSYEIHHPPEFRQPPVFVARGYNQEFRGRAEDFDAWMNADPENRR